MNTHNKYISNVFYCNTNIQFGDQAHVFTVPSTVLNAVINMTKTTVAKQPILVQNTYSEYSRKFIVEQETPTMFRLGSSTAFS